MQPYSLGARKPRILDFDIECRPLSWYGGDWVTKDVTAIAWSWGGEQVMCVAQGEMSGFSTPEADIASMLHNFVEAYNQADVVTGHFIRSFDLPVINAACVEVGLPHLGDKVTIDTKLDLIKFTGLSKSQENIAAVLGIEAPKVQMDQVKWRAANRLTPGGIAGTQERVIGDVIQHMEMREALNARGMLGRPRVWSASSNGGSKYSP